MEFITDLKNKVLQGGLPSAEEAVRLSKADFSLLTRAARELRAYFCGNHFHFCAIVSAKSGLCGEDCAFCAQSRLHKKAVEQYELMPPRKMAEKAVSHRKDGVERFSFVTSGKKLSDAEVDTICDSCRLIREQCDIGLCSCNGLLSRAQLERLHSAGVTRYHCNLETSRGFFPKICSTHSYDDKLQTLRDAKQAGMELCSGGIIGLGESMRDRIEMALLLRELGVGSVPVNVLHPIPGTPLEYSKPLSYEEICRTIAVFRFLLPSAELRFAGGRLQTPDEGRRAVESGLNAAITDNLLTTRGIQTPKDMAMAKSLGFKINT